MRSGLIDIDEFMTAIKSERLAELNLRTVLKKLGVHMETVEDRYAKFKNSNVRRRLMKREMERNVFEVVQKLCGVLESPLPDAEGRYFISATGFKKKNVFQ